MKVRVFVIVEDGCISQVLADDADSVDVVVIDYDVDGGDPNDFTRVPQSALNGDVLGHEDAYVSRWPSEEIPYAPQAIYDMAKEMFGEE